MDLIKARFSKAALIALENAKEDSYKFLCMLKKYGVDLSGNKKMTKLPMCTVYVNKDGIIDGIVFKKSSKSLESHKTILKTEHCKQRQKERNIPDSKIDEVLKNTQRQKGGKHVGEDGTTVVVKTPKNGPQQIATVY